jgi:transcriptional regulator with XRE-family HTH domain
MIKKIISTTDKHVGDRVRMRRVALGVSQSTLGAKVGVTFQQIQKYEKGTNRISASRLSQIADVLQVKEAYFF